ncbi:hypothetical protein BLA29_008159 [Euroglyphus maynei]|uniref:Uncharacterized protein n=1 Tax=Euroglyphus maynei TaxID=6958 RepID=A0A1Y3B936_EURMA|nr:hypothetical protein BLA29_008159 [Euroglyphus maynei]
MVGRADLQEFEDHLPDKDVARGFYAKYEPKEVLGSCKNGELFDYLTNVVTLSEKRTKWSYNETAIRSCRLYSPETGRTS